MLSRCPIEYQSSPFTVTSFLPTPEEDEENELAPGHICNQYEVETIQTMLSDLLKQNGQASILIVAMTRAQRILFEDARKPDDDAESIEIVDLDGLLEIRRDQYDVIFLSMVHSLVAPIGVRIDRLLRWLDSRGKRLLVIGHPRMWSRFFTVEQQ